MEWEEISTNSQASVWIGDVLFLQVYPYFYGTDLVYRYDVCNAAMKVLATGDDRYYSSAKRCAKEHALMLLAVAVKEYARQTDAQ